MALQKHDLISGECLLHCKEIVFKLDENGRAFGNSSTQFSDSSPKSFADERRFCAAVWVCLVLFCSNIMIL